MKYCLVCSESADWYVIPLDKKKEWLDNNMVWDEEGEDYPDWVEYVELENFTFERSNLSYTQELENAIKEAELYAASGGLDDTILVDIAHDHEVDVLDLRKELGWE